MNILNKLCVNCRPFSEEKQPGYNNPSVAGIYAAHTGCYNCLKHIVESKGYNVDTRAGFDYCQYNDGDSDGDENTRFTYSAFGLTAGLCASRYGNYKCLEIIQKLSNYNVNETTLWENIPTCDMGYFEYDEEPREYKEWNPLRTGGMLAAISGHSKCLKLSLEHKKYRVYQTDRKGCTVVYLALFSMGFFADDKFDVYGDYDGVEHLVRKYSVDL